MKRLVLVVAILLAAIVLLSVVLWKLKVRKVTVKYSPISSSEIVSVKEWNPFKKTLIVVTDSGRDAVILVSPPEIPVIVSEQKDGKKNDILMMTNGHKEWKNAFCTNDRVDIFLKDGNLKDRLAQGNIEKVTNLGPRECQNTFK